MRWVRNRPFGIVRGVTESISRRPIDAVLFDFHGTVAAVENAERCVALASAACGVPLDEARSRELAAEMARAGIAGGWPPPVIPPHLERAWEQRDLSTEDHRALFVGIADTVDSGVPGLSEAMYERLLDPAGWEVYPDTVPTMRALRERGIPVAAVSNIGFDIRAHGTAMGFADLVDSWVLSYEVGVCKPDPRIFRHACASLGVAPQRALMVGDTVADAGAIAAGCSVLGLPASPPGQPHGLGAVLALV